MTDPTLTFDLDTEAMMQFFSTLTTLELEHAMNLGLAVEDGLTEPSISDMFGILGVMAARRLGHKKITKTDIETIPLAHVSALISKASHTSPTVNQRTLDLLAELPGEGVRP